MDLSDRGSVAFGTFTSRKRTSVKLSPESIVKTRVLDGAHGFPLLVEPALEHVNLAEWVQTSREWVEARLLQYGALLFRDFAIGSVEQFENVTRALTPELMQYSERAAPRVTVARNVYTSTEYPASHRIPLHHEMSYSHQWPTKIWFYCAQPAREQGATPIANDREVFTRIDPAIKKTFMEKHVMYVRNYGEGVDLTWQDAFQTTDRAEVEAYCRQAHTSFEWRDGDRLRTRQVRQAVAVHPKTGDTVWFNHAHMFHVSNVDPAVRASLLEEFAEDELPRNAFYGDGSPIEASVLADIREAYDSAALVFPWQARDMLLLDNFLMSHGREAFVGPRRVLVAMAEPYTNAIPGVEENR